MIKRKLVEHAVPLSLILGVITFLLARANLVNQHNWETAPALGVAAIAFLITAGGSYLILNNVVDAYTFELATAKQRLFDYVRSLESQRGQVKDKVAIAHITSIIANIPELVRRTEEATPNKTLSTVGTLNNWANTADECITQFIDIEQHPQFHNDPQSRLARGREALGGLSTFLVNSIKLLETTDNVDFDVAARMLEATKFDLIS